jgi:hypothetical protein
MAKTKRTLKGTSRGRKATRVAKKPQKISWLAKGYPVLSSVTVLDDCPRRSNGTGMCSAPSNGSALTCRVERSRTASSDSATRF